MRVNGTRDVHAWNIQACQLLIHETTGLRFFVYDNHETQETDAAIVSHFADADAVRTEAVAAGIDPERYPEFLAEKALQAATCPDMK